jgi:nitrate reductase NapE component
VCHSLGRRNDVSVFSQLTFVLFPLVLVLISQSIREKER